ncbi:hypothetical protein [Phenylobacterium conjunctum]|jgi:hypothetical protein|uniref:DUF4410 domain-containing protein n=1 Tax=Phenylobacterium conjunctum TaxID=1298959 RepID=A0ABW3SZA1_9CAUL
MRLLLVSLLAAGAATSAVAAPPTVTVNLSPAVRKAAAETYGVAEVDRVAESLRQTVARKLDRTGALQGAQVDLTLDDVKPNRPTFKQLGDKPGLSYQSFSVGGARVTGSATAADGSVTPVSYQWYETDIRNAWYQPTWGDADRAFGRLADRLSRGDAGPDR